MAGLKSNGYKKRTDGQPVSLSVVAIDKGYIDGKIIESGEEFVFSGKVYDRTLAPWMEEKVAGSLEKALGKEKGASTESSASAPAKPKTAKPAAAKKATVKKVPPVHTAKNDNASSLV